MYIYNIYEYDKQNKQHNIIYNTYVLNTYSNMNDDMIRLLVEKTVRIPADAWFSIFVLIS